jgi:hypothetical protein
MLLHEIQRLVGAIQRTGRVVVLADPGVADADGDMADLGELVLGDALAEAFQDRLHGGLVGGAEEDHELFPAEAEQHVAPAETGAHLLRQQQDHLIAIDVAVVVVDALEMIDVENAQPHLGRFARRGLAFVAGHGRQERTRTGRQVALFQQALKLPFQAAPVVQASQFVVFAFVQQRGVVGVDAGKPVNQLAAGRRGHVAVQLQGGDRATVAHDRHHLPVQAVDYVGLGFQALHAAVQQLQRGADMCGLDRLYQVRAEHVP